MMPVKNYPLLWVLLALIIGMLIFGAHKASAQSILNPQTGTHFLIWDHDGTNTDHYEIRVNTDAPWINIGKPTPLQTPIPELALGAYLADVRACNATGCTNSDKALPITVIPATLPAPWVNKDIGDVRAGGNSAWAAGTFSVIGDGLDVWSNGDAFQFVYQPLGDNNQIVARVTAQAANHSYAKAGLMMRTSLSPTSTHAMINAIPDGTVEFINRTVDGKPSTAVWNSMLTKPIWLKLTRIGTKVTGSTSQDGLIWTVVASTDVVGVAYVGLVVTSHDANVLNASTFDSVAVSSGVVPAPAAPTNTLPVIK